jgi:uncharacterized SAM-binding protein YcdF (DUF218 family)
MKSTPTNRRASSSHWLRTLFLLALLVAIIWSAWVCVQINAVANQDQAQPCDAIAVFGAAEYGGHPSPVYHARLDHVVELYRQKIAPLVITLGGGSDRDSGNTEGGVGRDYLLANGVPFADIVVESHSIDTEQQVHRLAAIARENNLQHITVVSDGTHLFRIRELCRDAGLDVFTSPRPPLGHIDNYDLAMRYFHEILSYTSFRLGLNETWVHRWIEGKGDD